LKPLKLRFLKHMLFSQDRASSEPKIGRPHEVHVIDSSASSNLVFEVQNIKPNQLDEINEIGSVTDRLRFILEYAGILKYYGPEKRGQEKTLFGNDELITSLVGHLVLKSFITNTKEVLKLLLSSKKFLKSISLDEDKAKVTLYIYILNFFFKGDANNITDYTSYFIDEIDAVSIGNNGSFFLGDIQEEFLSAVCFDAPSSVRSRYGKLYKEKDGRLFIKLNLSIILKATKFERHSLS
jgi:DNA (cytosine-5)-methyltransferase 1